MKKNTRAIIFTFVFGMTALLATGCGAKKEDTGSGAAGDGVKIAIEVEDYGTIHAVLDSENAPETVENFVNLVKEGFYDGLTFHRIIDGFMIQGGDPNGDGTGGSDQKIKGEFSQNGVENKISHKRGVLSMARAQDMDSASSQFFIVQADSDFLDGQYAGFGHVIDGMDIVDEICEKVTGQDANGVLPKEDQPEIVSIRIVE
ncbi:MAG: peptidylprolyl isomerase [Lachnospiraceae bacterium]|jgi:peptidyl-prolyl cis-trans isomerase B (cyclophilin B)|nr:peptidylprolyl isomerase [Lachnospiraceae bacterium]RKJ51847.1 peptidylprolyl isomerase [bacterium 1XD42-54]